MSLKVDVRSPAKINLHLDIRGRRNDGYHQLISIFQMISLYDEIEICSLTDNKDCVIQGDFDFPTNQNLIYKAYHLFRAKSGITAGVRIRVHKRIPQGAGLGGGSSNAAAVLRGLTTLFKRGYQGDRLAEWGAALGSDVAFFCLYPAALVEGRGEIVSARTPRNDYHVVLVYPQRHIDTTEAYAWWDQQQASERVTSSCSAADYWAAQYAQAEPRQWEFINSFRPVVTGHFHELGDYLREMRGLGADYVNISGSGSAYYGIFKDEKKAISAFSRLKNRFNLCWLTKPLDRLPKIY